MPALNVANLVRRWSDPANAALFVVDDFVDISQIPGCVADGVTDVAPFINAVNAAGVPCYIPPGHWLIKSQINVVSAATIYGVRPQLSAVPTTGTWLLIDPVFITNGQNPFSVASHVEEGTTFLNFAVYETGHPLPGAGWAPAAYPFVFVLQNVSGEVYFDGIYFCGCNQWIQSVVSGRTSIGDIRGQAFTYCLYITSSYDLTHIERLHVWPYWSTDPNVLAYQQLNLDIFILARVDGLNCLEAFTFASRSFCRTIPGGDGDPTSLAFGIVFSDSTKYGLWVGAGSPGLQNYTRVHFQSLECDGIDSGPNATGPGTPPQNVATIAGAFAVFVDANQLADITIDHLDSEYYPNQVCNIASTFPATTLTIGSWRVQTYNQSNIANLPLINVTPSSDVSTPHIIKLGTTPWIAALFGIKYNLIANPGYFVTPTSHMIFDWPGFKDSLSFINPAAGGATYDMPAFTKRLVMFGAGGTMTGNTIQLPPFPHDGQEAVFSSSQPMASPTVAPSSSDTAYNIVGTLTALAAFKEARYVFSYLAQSWFLVSSA